MLFLQHLDLNIQNGNSFKSMAWSFRIFKEDIMKHRVKILLIIYISVLHKTFIKSEYYNFFICN